MSRAASHLRQAVACLRQAPGAALMAASTVAAALTISGAAWLLARSLEAGLRTTAAEARLTVFVHAMDPEQGELRAREISGFVGEGARAEFVPPDVALVRLRADLGETGEALDTLAANPLPPSIEVRLARGDGSQPELERVRGVASMLGALPYVDEVDYGRTFLERLETLVVAVRAAGLLLFAAVLGVALFLIGNVVRLTVYARRDEVDILRLVGATDAFIAAPFVIEGALQGLAGGVLAAVALAALDRVGLPQVAAVLGFGREFLADPLNPFFWALVALGGALAGALASVVAVMRFLRSAP